MTLNENIQQLISKIDNFYERPIVIFTGCSAERADETSTLYYVDFDKKTPRDDLTTYVYNSNRHKNTITLNYQETVNNFKDDTWGVLEKGVNDAY